MKNVTLSLDDETYRNARVAAAERGTSLSRLVKQLLIELATDRGDTEHLKQKERVLRERITAFRASDRLTRDDVHGRSA